MDIDAHKMFEMVKNGEIALEDFLLWVEDVEDYGYEKGRDAGYWDGYDNSRNYDD